MHERFGYFYRANNLLISLRFPMKKYLLFITILVTSLQSIGQNVQERYQRAKIFYSEDKPLSQLSAFGVTIDHGINKKGVYYISEFAESELRIAKENGYQVEILIPDLKAHFLEENKKNTPSQKNANASCDANSNTDYETPDNFTLGSMGGYLTYQEVLDQLDLMKVLFPNLITTPSNISNFVTEGVPDNSVTPSIGGNGIKWVKISDNPDNNTEGEPQILHTSIHHAREPVSLMQLIFYMWYLLENYETDLEVQNIVDNTELYFVPVVNPDGYLYNQVTDPNGGGFWRKNRRLNGNGSVGVDNNRNYNFFIDGNPNNGVWGGPGSSGNPGSEIYRGTAPFSEVETQAMRWFVENHNFTMAFNNHTSGELLYYPHAYADVATPDEDLFIAISNELVSENDFTNLRDSPFSGDSDDFMYGTVGTHDQILAFTPEIGTSFWPPANQIEDLSKTMLFLNLTAAKMVNNFAQIDEVGPTYVDQSQNSADFNIRRLGLSGDGDFTVSLIPISNNIGTVGAPQVFTNIDLLETQSGSINYSLTGNVNSENEILFDLVVNNGTFDTRISVRKLFGTLNEIFFDDGSSTTTNFNSNGFSVTSESFVSPSTSITDSPNGNYPNNTNESITLSDPIDLTDATGANVTFFAQWEIEDSFDFAQFQISIDGGNSWIGQCGNFTNPGSDQNLQPTGEPIYDGDSNGWVQEEIDLSDYLGEIILARFIIRSDNIIREDGFYFDDLTFNIVEEAVLSVEDTLATNFSVFPNPVSNYLNINTNLSNYDIDIYTIQGQRISETNNLSGSQQIDYSAFARGIYIMILSSEGATTSLKIIKE